jgi:Flp pilus assembly protein TadD
MPTTLTPSTPRAPHLPALLIAVALALAAGTSRAVDTTDASPAPAGAKAVDLKPAQARIAQQDWPGALTELRRIDARGNADWNNLMGFALRKSTPPDLAAAERYYDEALRLDPQHRGALEYSGELYLMRGDLARAEQRLATLDKVCRLPCEEYTDLKRAVEKYKAANPR